MEFRAMRLLVMFDLPTSTAADRKIYGHFRKFLLQDGYFMMQFSVYSRVTRNHDDAQKHIMRLHRHLPTSGSVRCLLITEKQYSKMKILVGEKTDEEKILVPEELIEL